MSERKLIVSGWLVATAVHLSGVVAFGVASYLDRTGAAWWLGEPLAYWGLATTLIGPAAILALIIRQRITDWQIPVAIAVACGIEFTAALAMLPLIQ